MRMLIFVFGYMIITSLTNYMEVETGVNVWGAIGITLFSFFLDISEHILSISGHVQKKDKVEVR